MPGPWEQYQSDQTAPAGPKPWEAFQPAPAAKPHTGAYEPTSAFMAATDAALGKGRWRDTGDYRPPWREFQLQRQGAGTARGESSHTRGSVDAPGAHDFVPVGESVPEALKKVRGEPGVKDAFYEAQSGTQGGHIHVDMSDDYTAPAPAQKPWERYAQRAPGSSAGRVVPPSRRPPADGTSPPRGPPKGSPEVRPSPGLLGDIRGEFVHGLQEDVREQYAPQNQSGIGAALAGFNTIQRAIGSLTVPFMQRQYTELSPEHARQKGEFAAGVLAGMVPIPGAAEGEAAARGVGEAIQGGRELLAGGREALAAREAKGLTTSSLPRPHVAPRRVLAATRQKPADAIYAPPGRSGRPPPQTPAGGAPGGSGGPTPPQSTVQAVRSGAGAVQKLFAPATIGEGRPTAAVIRASRGRHQLMADQAIYDMSKSAKAVGNLPVPQQRALVAYIEGRSAGAQLGNPKLQKAADTIKAVYKRYADRIGYVLGEDGPSFITDYYTHMWKERPADVEDTMRRFYARQGSGANLKKRTIPTIAEGIEAGLTPVTENPIEATGIYVQNMSRYLTTHDVLNQLRDMGLAKWHPPGAQPKGWVPLDGIKTSKVRPTEPPAQIQLYAPEHAARVYNNWIGRGFEAGDVAPLFQGARKLANGVTMLKLGLSGYHAFNMANEALVTEGARAVQALSRGKLATAAKAGANWATIGGPAVQGFRRGRQMEQELLGIKAPDVMSRKVNDAFVNSGGQLRMDKLYQTSGVGSFYQAAKSGTFVRELTDAFRALGRGTLTERGKATMQLAARTIQSMSDPLFQDVIPNLKRGAFANAMHDFIAANPQADQKAIDAYAIKLQDSIDNRFGELVQDNLFWKRQMKQTAQLLLLSPSWKIGTWREIGGGLVDLPASAKGLMTGAGVTPRTAYDVSLAASTAMVAGIATYLMTGTAPHGRDFMAPRTGGTDVTSGEPERAALPGYQKDVYEQADILGQGPAGWGPGELNYAASGANPALKSAYDLISNRDYRGMPIYRPPGADPVEGEPTAVDQILEDMMPITFGQFGKRKTGTNISPAMTAMGLRPSPMYVTAPDDLADIRRKVGNRAWQAKLRSDQRLKAEETP